VDNDPGWCDRQLIIIVNLIDPRPDWADQATQPSPADWTADNPADRHWSRQAIGNPLNPADEQTNPDSPDSRLLWNPTQTDNERQTGNDIELTDLGRTAQTLVDPDPVVDGPEPSQPAPAQRTDPEGTDQTDGPDLVAGGGLGPAQPELTDCDGAGRQPRPIEPVDPAQTQTARQPRP